MNDQDSDAGAQGLETTEAKMLALENNLRAVEATANNALKAQESIADKSRNIQAALEHSQRVTGDLDIALNQAQSSAQAAELLHQGAKTSIAELTEISNLALLTKGRVIEIESEIDLIRNQCEHYAAMNKKLAEISETTEQRIESYELRLRASNAQHEVLLTKINSLLPRATSAGLSSAFNSRRKSFKIPQIIWQLIFIASLTGFFLFGCLPVNLISADKGPLTLQSVFMALLQRLPLALPIIWLAFHASHKAALAQRVEEDYAFKEAVSSSFEGFRREMAELQAEAAPESALARLCDGVLAVITNPPGRIYEKHKLNHTPLTAFAESFPKIAEGFKALGLQVIPKKD